MTDGDRLLRRRLGLLSASCAMVASMVGQGVFVSTGFLGHDLQSPYWILALWGVGGGLALLGALTYAELGSRLPHAGGEYAFLHAGVSPLWGFLAGWGGFLWAFSAPIALCALACVAYTSTFAPALDLEDGIELLRLPLGGGEPLRWMLGNAVAAAIILALTSIHCVHTSAGIAMQNGLTFLKVTAIALLVALALISGRASVDALTTSGTPPPVTELAPLLGKNLVFIFLAYAGWNSATYLAGEVRDPARNLPRAALYGTLAVTALYLVINGVYLLAVPVTAMEPSPDIAARAAAVYFGASGERWISAIIAVTQLGTISAIALSGSRVYFAMARAGVIPRALGRLTTNGTPRFAMMLQGAVAAALALIGRFDTLALYASTVLMAFSALTVVALYRLRRPSSPGGETTDPGEPAVYRAPRGVPALFLLTSSAILVLAAIEFRAGILVPCGTVLLGVPFYYGHRRRERRVR